MKEAEFAKRIEETMAYLGLRWHHETDSRRSKAGFPDYCIVGPHGVMFLEIKADKGVVSPQQAAWIADLADAEAATGSSYADRGDLGQAVRAYVAYPKDWSRVFADLKRIAGK